MARSGQPQGQHSHRDAREAAQAGGPVRLPRLICPGDLPGLTGGGGDGECGGGASGGRRGIGRERHQGQGRIFILVVIGCSLPSHTILHFVTGVQLPQSGHPVFCHRGAASRVGASHTLAQGAVSPAVPCCFFGHRVLVQSPGVGPSCALPS